MLNVSAGEPLINLIKLAYRADQPVLLHGKHGVGKSEIFAEAASRLGVGMLSRDLSMLEPVDLIGIPQVTEEGKTRYAFPSFLPAGGEGILLLEELNRCPRYMQSPCLQLLTARQLNDYDLPRGWLPCAAVNDSSDGYFTDEIDPALLSRFLQVRVEADAEQWGRWARTSNRIHAKVLSFVEASPGVFDDPQSNPRAWAYASRLLSAWEEGSGDRDLLATALSGMLGEKWALAFLRSYSDERSPLRPEEIIEDYAAHRACVRGWVEMGRLDVLAASLERLKRHIQPQRVYDAVFGDPQSRANLETFVSDVPAELKRQFREWLMERGFAEPPRRRNTKGVRP